jgi:arylsulfatase A-like enzyme
LKLGKALSCYGRFAGVTPHLDALAAEGVRYLAAYTTVPITLPAHASMLTGLYPPRHGIRDNGMAALSPEADTLAERARAHDVRTAAFVAAVVLDASFGLDQGFEHYDEARRGAERTQDTYESRPASEVIDRALAWFRARDRDEPFFVWVHLFDPHAPYEPPPDLTGRFPHPYLGDVAGMDRELGRLFDALRADGTLDGTTVLVIGDHGEALGEHGEATHGSYCFESTLRVPLLLRHPDGKDAGAQSLDVASVADVAPTLADALGLPADPNADGRSQLRPVPPDRGVYFESYKGWLSFGGSPQAGWLDAEGKYVHSSEPQLFDPRADPGEERDLAAERAGALPRYRKKIAEVAARPALPAATPETLDDALLADIRKLGYAGLGAVELEIPHPLADTGLPSPQAIAPLHAETLRAMALFLEKRYDEAGAILERVLREQPESYLAIERYAICLMHQGRHAEAIPWLERMLAARPWFASAWYNLGRCLAHEGRREDAIRALEEAVRREPEEPEYRRELARVGQPERE